MTRGKLLLACPYCGADVLLDAVSLDVELMEPDGRVLNVLGEFRGVHRHLPDADDGPLGGAG